MPSYALSNFTAPDAYLPSGVTGTNSRAQVTGPATLSSLPPLDHINLDVANSAIYFSLAETNDLLPAGRQFGAWQPEVFMLPGSRTLDRDNLVGIRIRAALTGANLAATATQAQVTVECVE